MSGRPLQGASEYRGGLQNESYIRGRESLAQVVGFDTATGRVTVRLAQSSVKHTLNAPFRALRLDGVRSSWSRRMPQLKEVVSIGYTIDNQPFIRDSVGWGSIGDAPPVDSGGAPRQNIIQYALRAAANLRLGTGTTPVPREFLPLEPGEFDERSSGGAYIKGSADGILTTAAGLVRRTQQAASGWDDASALVHAWRGPGFAVQLGQPRLLGSNLDPLPEDQALGAVASAVQEGAVGLAIPTGSLVFVDWADGDIRTVSGLTAATLQIPVDAPVGQTPGVRLRSRKRWYNLGLEVASAQMDAAGKLDLSVVGLQIRALSSSLHAVSQNTIGADSRVALGSSTAVQSLVLGDAWRTAERTKCIAEAAAWGFAALAFEALGAVLLTDNPAASAACITAGVKAAAAGTAATTFATLLGADAAPSVLLSTKVKTD